MLGTRSGRLKWRARVCAASRASDKPSVFLKRHVSRTTKYTRDLEPNVALGHDNRLILAEFPCVLFQIREKIQDVGMHLVAIHPLQLVVASDVARVPRPRRAVKFAKEL